VQKPLYLVGTVLKIDEWSDGECHTELRVTKPDVDELLCEQRTVCGGIEGLYFIKKVGLPLPLH